MQSDLFNYITNNRESFKWIDNIDKWIHTNEAKYMNSLLNNSLNIPYNDRLHNAIINHYYNACYYLLCVRNPDGSHFNISDNAIIDSAICNNIVALDILLKLPKSRGIDPTCLRNEPLIKAVECNNHQAVELLLNNINRGLNPNARIHECIQTAIKNENKNIINLFLSHNLIDSNKYPEINDILKPDLTKFTNGLTKYNADNRLKIAIKEGNKDAVCELIKFGANPSINNNEPIRRASHFGFTDIVEYLLSLEPKYNINPSAYNNDAIRHAARFGHFNIVKLLLDDGRICVEANNYEAVKMAEKNGFTDIVELINKYSNKI